MTNSGPDDVGIFYPPPPDQNVSVVFKFEPGLVGPKLSITIVPKFHGALPALSREGWRKVMEELEAKWPQIEAEQAQRQREEQQP